MTMLSKTANLHGVLLSYQEWPLSTSTQTSSICVKNPEKQSKASYKAYPDRMVKGIKLTNPRETSPYLEVEGGNKLLRLNHHQLQLTNVQNFANTKENIKILYSINFVVVNKCCHFHVFINKIMLFLNQVGHLVILSHQQQVSALVLVFMLSSVTYFT